MKLAINQAYFLPYIGYFQLIASVDKFIAYELVSFRKKSWMTRNSILKYGSEDKLSISVPVARQSSFKRIHEIHLSEDYKAELVRLLNKIRHNYRRAPYFETVFPLLSRLLTDNPQPSLHGFNVHIIREICAFIGINTEIQEDNKAYNHLEALLLRQSVYSYETGDTLTQIDRKTQRLLSIATNEVAKSVVNLNGGQALYDQAIFSDHGLQLSFLELPEHQYPQFTENFVPRLSIVDVLMHCGPAETLRMVNNYKLLNYGS